MSISNFNIIALLLATVAINYYTPVPYIGFNFTKKYNIINKLYFAFFSAFIIILTDILLNSNFNFFNNNKNNNEDDKKSFFIWIIILTSGIFIFYFLISKQLFIDQIDYLATMRENNIMDTYITNILINNKKIDNNANDYTLQLLKNREIELKHIDDILAKYNL